MIYRYKVQWIVVFFWQNIEVWTLLHPHTTHTTMRSSTMGKLCISRGIRGENPPETEGPKVNVRRVWRMSLSKNPPCPSFFSIQIGWIKAGLTPKQIMFMYFCIFVFLYMIVYTRFCKKPWNTNPVRNQPWFFLECNKKSRFIRIQGLLSISVPSLGVNRGLFSMRFRGVGRVTLSSPWLLRWGSSQLVSS